MASQSSGQVTLKYAVRRTSRDWTLSEEPAAESRLHDLILDLLKALLIAWAAREGRNAQVGRNLAVRWDEAHPNVGIDPDIYVVEPPPPEGDDVVSLKLWQTGHHAPLLAVEVVSASNASKDYVSAPEKYAASGTGELWIFDPKLAGPTAHGGPYRLQVWARGRDGEFERVYAGDGPTHSPAVSGWLFAVNDGQRLRIAEDEQGTRWYMTAEESERAAKGAALRRVAELESELARRGV